MKKSIVLISALLLTSPVHADGMGKETEGELLYLSDMVHIMCTGNKHKYNCKGYTCPKLLPRTRGGVTDAVYKSKVSSFNAVINNEHGRNRRKSYVLKNMTVKINYEENYVKRKGCE